MNLFFFHYLRIYPTLLDYDNTWEQFVKLINNFKIYIYICVEKVYCKSKIDGAWRIKRC